MEVEIRLAFMPSRWWQFWSPHSHQKGRKRVEPAVAVDYAVGVNLGYLLYFLNLNHMISCLDSRIVDQTCEVKLDRDASREKSLWLGNRCAALLSAFSKTRQLNEKCLVAEDKCIQMLQATGSRRIRLALGSLWFPKETAELWQLVLPCGSEAESALRGQVSCALCSLCFVVKSKAPPSGAQSANPRSSFGAQFRRQPLGIVKNSSRVRNVQHGEWFSGIGRMLTRD